MRKAIFISYCHAQGTWVRDRLVPTLEGGGSPPLLLDTDRFVAGLSVVGQMDSVQDKADATIAVLSEDYLASPYCMHELQRAQCHHTIIPVVRNDCNIPATLRDHDPVLCVDLRDPE